MTRRKWFWILLFVLGVILLGCLALIYNWVIVEDHFKLMELAPLVVGGGKLDQEFPWMKVLGGSVGFGVALAGLILFFVRLLQEMRLNQRQSEFLAAVTHELKTPLSTIELCASLLQNKATPEESKKLWTSHQAELQRLKNQIESLLEAARMQVRLPVPEYQIMDLESWLESQWTSWTQRVPIKREGDRMQCTVRMDPKLMSMIFENLLDNARKYSLKTPDVTLETHLEGLTFSLKIKDQGLGFHPDVSKKIFERFFRAKATAPYAIPGTGLGLFLALQAARTQGFSLKGFSSGEGRGAEFSLSGEVHETF